MSFSNQSSWALTYSEQADRNGPTLALRFTPFVCKPSHFFFNEMLIPGKLFHCLGWKCFYLCNIQVHVLSTEIKPHSKSCIHKKKREREREKQKEREREKGDLVVSFITPAVLLLFMYNLKLSTQFHWLISMWFHYSFKSCQKGALWTLWFHYT